MDEEPHPIVQAASKKAWKRFTMTLIAVALLWLFLHEHRNWTWAYFESVMTLDSPDPAQIAAAQVIASASISALTTALLASLTTLGALLLFFVTGDTAAITSMFKFTSAATNAGNASVTSATTTSLTETIAKTEPKPRP